jgi:hypothetical protein
VVSVDDEIAAEAEHLFDLALADGLDTGRYAMVVDPVNPTAIDPRWEPGGIVRGPFFDSLPPRPFNTPADRIGRAQREIDQMLGEPRDAVTEKTERTFVSVNG